VIDDIKAVRREITNIYTKGTYNPGKASGEKEHKFMYWGRYKDRNRYREVFKHQDREEDEEKEAI